MTTSELDSRIPVTLLTGFLGSGKTSLLNHWLTDEAMSNAAVIINEFGEIGIDRALVSASDDSTIELANGCLCCVMTGDLVDTLRTLYMRRESGEIRPFEHVVIETSGMADPGPVMQVLMSRPAALRYRLARTVTTVDTVHGVDTLERYVESQRQIAVADHLILTKMDRRTHREQAARLQARLSTLNPSARMHHSSQRQRLPAGAILQADTRELSKTEDDAASPGLLNLGPSQFDDHADTDRAGNETGSYLKTRTVKAARHTRGIEHFAMTFDAPMQWEHLAAWLDALTMAHARQILRIKGVFYIEGREQAIAIHAVQGLFNPPEPLPHAEEARQSRVVFITYGIQKSYVAEVFDVIASRALRTAPAPAATHAA